MLIGYARVSTDDQHLDLQRDALAKAGCERVFADAASGVKTERTGLMTLLATLRRGDLSYAAGTASLTMPVELRSAAEGRMVLPSVPREVSAHG